MTALRAKFDGVRAFLRHALETWPTPPRFVLLAGDVETVPAETVVLLQATSPIRDEGLVDRCIRRFLETGADSLATGFICKYVEYGRNHLRRQDMEGFFYDDGNVYVHRAWYLRQGRYWGDRLERMVIDRVYNHEIDGELDLVIVESVMRHLLERHGSLD